MGVSLGRVRIAASQLRLEHKQVNCAELACLVKLPYCTLSDTLSHHKPRFKQALRVERCRGSSWKQPQLYRQYETAARAIRDKGVLPSLSTLATHLKWRLKRVQKYLQSHPDLAERLHLYTEYEAQMWQAARAMLSRGEHVTRLGLADEMRCAYQTVQRVLRGRSSFLKDLGICRAPRCSGVGKRVHNKKPHRGRT